MPRRNLEEKTPKGGWLGPPSFSHEYNLVPLATAMPGGKGKDWKWKVHTLTAKEKKRHDKYQKRMKQMDKEGLW